MKTLLATKGETVEGTGIGVQNKGFIGTFTLAFVIDIKAPDIGGGALEDSSL